MCINSLCVCVERILIAKATFLCFKFLLPFFAFLFFLSSFLFTFFLLCSNLCVCVCFFFCPSECGGVGKGGESEEFEAKGEEEEAKGRKPQS